MDRVSIFGVDYQHLRLPGGDDLYLTEYGEPFAEQLLPENHWSDRAWFEQHSTKLFGHVLRASGSSTIYRVRTKAVNGRDKDIVLKWNRMGQDVPGFQDNEDLLSAEFNSPYEEFALVMEMRNTRHESPGGILTHKPLAIYVPSERAELWQLGRSEHKMKAKMRSHSVELDMFRPYAVIYEWIEGVDAAVACHTGVLSQEEMASLARQAEEEMRAKGFVVRDRKPHHVIVRLDARGQPVRDRQGRVPYALIDFELLERTPEREAAVRQLKRREYLQRQAHRFEMPGASPLPAHLRAMNVLGVDYIYGPAESTNGALWVVGRDPSLFDYFLPERWERTARTRLSPVEEVFHTVSKDNIQLVWKVSKVGRRARADPFVPGERELLAHGYNSPFEEVALAVEVAARGVGSTYPRAIYMTGHEPAEPEALCDDRRFAGHAGVLTPDGQPVLRKDRGYAVIWGYWNKPDAVLAEADSDYYLPIDALHALHKGLLGEAEYLALMETSRAALRRAGVEDLNLRGSHILLALDSRGSLVKDVTGLPERRLCNFELLRRLPAPAPAANATGPHAAAPAPG